MIQHKSCPTCHGEGKLANRTENAKRVAKTALTVVKGDLVAVLKSDDFAALRFVIFCLHGLTSIVVLIYSVVTHFFPDPGMTPPIWAQLSTYGLWFVALPLLYIRSVYKKTRDLTSTKQ
jgi:hypothetical protein